MILKKEFKHLKCLKKEYCICCLYSPEQCSTEIRFFWEFSFPHGIDTLSQDPSFPKISLHAAVDIYTDTQEYRKYF